MAGNLPLAIERTKERIAEQRALVARLAASDRDTTDAVQLLNLLEEILDLMVRHQRGPDAT